MHGPEIFARSLSRAHRPDKFGNLWQYHSRSDNHSKIACWALLFDLMQDCPLLVSHISERKVGFGINHAMWDFKTKRKKNLDLVLCSFGSSDGRNHATFSELATVLQIDLDSNERKTLAALPIFENVPVGTVYAAVESKACMTEHLKALPRLHDELNSSHLAIHGAADAAIAAGFVFVNMSATFLSSDRNKFSMTERAPIVTQHRQPFVTQRTVAKLEQIPRRTHGGVEGFDALGIVVVDLKNDGSAVHIVEKPPAPGRQDPFHYDQMIRRISALYASRFSNV